MILGTMLWVSVLPAHAASSAGAMATPQPHADPARHGASKAPPAKDPPVGNLKMVDIQGYHDFTSQVLSAKQLRNSSQPAESVTRSDIAMFGPDAGGTQALSVLPNVYVSGTDNYSATGRQQISIRGIKVGYNSIPGDLETNAITVELDGVPLNSLSQGTGWHSVEIPLGVLMSGENVIIGPGNPSERWYNSMGGTIDFIPVQPTPRAGGKVMLAGGSSSTLDASAVYNTGAINGWSTVFGFATGRSQAIRDTADSLPADTEEIYIKTRKQLDGGSVSFGGYYQRNHEWRPNMIPLTPVPYVNEGGVGIGAPYSQQTSGFYATLPRSVWHKTIEIQNYLLWSHLHLELSSSLKLSNILWVRLGKVVHIRSNNELLPNNPLYAASGYSDPSNPDTNHEHYIERSRTLGDRLAFAETFNRMDTLKFGGYMITARAKNESPSWSTFDGSSLAQPEQFGASIDTNFYWAAFLEDDFRPIQRLKIVPGIRVVEFISDFSNLSPTAACAAYGLSGCTYGAPLPAFPVLTGPTRTVLGYAFPGESFQFNSGSIDTNPDQTSNFVRYEPSLGVNYEALRDLNLFANFSISRHNPNSGNLDQSPPVIFATLKPAKSEQYDFGLRYAALRLGALRNIYASLDFFHNLLADETITYSPSAPANQPNVTYFGYGSATFKGVDFSFRADFSPHWSGFANVGYLKSRWNEYQSPITPSGTQSTGYGLPVSNSPKDTLNAGATYRLRLPFGRLRATLWDQYIGKRYLFDKNQGLPTTIANPAYDLLNVSLSARTRWLRGVIPGVRSSTFSLQVLNLTDKQYNSTEYISSGGYFQTSSLPNPQAGYIIANPGAPRLVYGSVTLKF